MACHTVNMPFRALKLGYPTVVECEMASRIHSASYPLTSRIRFEFPERPGALMRFLQKLRSDWNISLFHYRNHGADYGRVLVGIQVPGNEMGPFRRFLRELGYPYADETRNPAYRLFLV